MPEHMCQAQSYRPLKQVMSTFVSPLGGLEPTQGNSAPFWTGSIPCTPHLAGRPHRGPWSKSYGNPICTPTGKNRALVTYEALSCCISRLCVCVCVYRPHPVASAGTFSVRRRWGREWLRCTKVFVPAILNFLSLNASFCLSVGSAGGLLF